MKSTPEQRARALGFAISHAPGCPGVHFPGIGLVWDEALSDERKHAAIDSVIALIRPATRAAKKL